MFSRLTVQKICGIAGRALFRNRLQTALTISGMSIGVATVLTTIALASGAQEAIRQQVRAAGMNVLVVTAGNYKMKQQWTSDGETDEQRGLNDPGPTPSTPAGASPDRVAGQESAPASERSNNPILEAEDMDPENLAGLGASDTLSLDDARAIRLIPGVQFVSATLAENARATAEGRDWFTRLDGEDATLPAIRRAWVIPHGRFFHHNEVERAEDVAVLGSIVSRRLFGDTNPVGRSVSIKRRAFRVVGEIASGSWMVRESEGDQQFDAVYIPVTTAQKLLQRTSLTRLTVSTESTGAVDQVRRAISATLRRRHDLDQTKPNDFVVASEAHQTLARGGMRTDVARAVVGNVSYLDRVTLDELGKTLERASRTMTALLVSIAAVSLVVGGIGIMNIMLLSVTERTREIGIRRAVGARSHEVLIQFLLEAVLLSGFGGLVGICVGLSATLSVARFVGWSASVSVWSVVVSVFVAAGTGIVFGYYPARRAALVIPMTALRHE